VEAQLRMYHARAWAGQLGMRGLRLPSPVRNTPSAPDPNHCGPQTPPHGLANLWHTPLWASKALRNGSTWPTSVASCQGLDR